MFSVVIEKFVLLNSFGFKTYAIVGLLLADPNSTITINLFDSHKLISTSYILLIIIVRAVSHVWWAWNQ